MEIKGNLFNIQKYTIHDGPGIRTELFFKGCPMHCKWCSNPEGICKDSQIGLYTVKCIGVDKCGLCLKDCPYDEKESPLIVKENKVVQIDRDKCNGCFRCIEHCYSGALKRWGEWQSVSEVMEIILQDRLFYEKSGGGVTLNGGEVTMQSDFALAVLKACKAEHIHTCVETSMMCRFEDLEKLFLYSDIMITDIKTLDTEVMREYIGGDINRILSNIEKTVQYGMPLIIRIPVIPGINDNIREIQMIARFISVNLRNRVIQVQLLPYKKLGEDKYASLGVLYPMGKDFKMGDLRKTEEQLRQYVELMKQYGIPAVSGANEIIKETRR